MYIPLLLQLGRVSQLKWYPAACTDLQTGFFDKLRFDKHSAGKGIFKEDYLRSNRRAALHAYTSNKNVYTSILYVPTHKYTYSQEGKSGQISVFNGLCFMEQLVDDVYPPLKSYRKRLNSSHVTDRFLNFCKLNALLLSLYICTMRLKATSCPVSTWDEGHLSSEPHGNLCRFC